MVPSQTADADSLEQSRMTLGEHLDELRVRLIRSTIAIAVTFAVGWSWHEVLAEVALEPYGRARVWLEVELVEAFDEKVEADPEITWEKYFTSADPESRELLPHVGIPEMPRGDAAGTGFFFYMRICFYFALFVGGPVVLWQMWQFIAAGLYKNEKRALNRYFPFSAVLFLGGVVFGYFLMVPYALFFLARMSLTQVTYWQTIDNYLTFLTSLTLALGVVFQLPVIMLALTKVGLVEPKLFSKYRGHFIVGALIVAALLTPPDPFTQMLMGVPIIILYELGAVLARIAYKKKADVPAVR